MFKSHQLIHQLILFLFLLLFQLGEGSITKIKPGRFAGLYNTHTLTLTLTPQHNNTPTHANITCHLILSRQCPPLVAEPSLDQGNRHRPRGYGCVGHVHAGARRTCRIAFMSFFILFYFSFSFVWICLCNSLVPHTLDTFRYFPFHSLSIYIHRLLFLLLLLLIPPLLTHHELVQEVTCFVYFFVCLFFFGQHSPTTKVKGSFQRTFHFLFSFSLNMSLFHSQWSFSFSLLFSIFSFFVCVKSQASSCWAKPKKTDFFSLSLSFCCVGVAVFKYI